MTDDYKKRLIEYVTGLLQIEEEKPTDFDPEEAYISDEDYNLGKYEDVIVALRGKYSCINGILESDFNDTLVMYGAYQENLNENSKGFLIFFTNNSGMFYPTKISLLTTRGIQFLKFDEESNRVFGVTGDRATYKGAQDNDCYFVYFNNLFLAYEDGVDPEQTYSYKIWEDGSQQFFCRDIVKKGDTSRYLIFGTQFTNLNYPTVIDLEIKVGESNTQVNYITGSNYLGYAFYGEYNGDTPFFRMIVFDNTVGVKTFKQALSSGGSITYGSITISTEIKTQLNIWVHPDFVSNNEDEIYFTHLSVYTKPNTYQVQRSTLYKFDGFTNTITEVYYKEIDQEFESDNVVLKLAKDQNVIYLFRHTNSGDDMNVRTEVADVSNHPNLQESDWYGGATTPYVDFTNLCNQQVVLKRIFNMLYFESFAGFFRDNQGDPNEDVSGGQAIFTTIQQRIGYTGYPYTDYSSLVPRYATVCIMDFPSFCRNVYNITKFENTTTASVEIPAQYCNFSLNNGQKLYGVTNYNLIDNFRPLRKNKYEVVHLNFINTINVIDEDTDTLYPYSAIRVNYSVNSVGQINYDNCKCVKYRKNYSDQTSATSTMSWSSIDDYNKQTSLIVYADKDIESIDLISSDQSAVFLHIPCNLEQGKYYKIKQKARVGDRPEPVDLQYNGENVLYNNEQVQVYV